MLFFTFAEGAKGPWSIIPQDALVVSLVKINPSDPGLNFLLPRWQRQLIARTPGKREAIEALFAKTSAQEVWGLALEVRGKIGYLIIASFTGASQKRAFTQILNELIFGKAKPKKLYFKNCLIKYHTQSGDFTAYTFWRNYVMVGTNKEVITSALSQPSSVSLRENFREKADVIAFINNKNQKFTPYLREWEKKLGITVLLSAEVVESIKLALDICNSQTIKGKIIFELEPSAETLDTEDDASFLGEVLKRNLVGTEISWQGKVSTSQNKVRLDFQASGLRSFWLKRLK
jgi:hypothetical protein